MKPLVIVKTGSTVPAVAQRRGDFECWITAGLGVASSRVRVVCVAHGEALPEFNEVAGAVVTGSSAMVTDREPWSLRAAAWLADAVAAEVPVLGICYGHQLLADALGGTVARNPRGREIGTVDVMLTTAAREDALLGEFPGPLRVQTSHLESVVELPPAALHLASSLLDPNHAFRIGPTAWGVQFHPEFDADIMRGYLGARREEVLAEGLDVEALELGVEDGPDGFAVLQRFAEIAAA
jgi:GMP synthase (glutamine-hydrolysing)